MVIQDAIDRWKTNEVAFAYITTKGFYNGKDVFLFKKQCASKESFQGYYESARLQIVSPSFDSNSSTYLKYAKATAFISGVSSYAINMFKTAQGTVIINGTSRTVNGVMKTSTGMTVFHNAGSQSLVLAPQQTPVLLGIIICLGLIRCKQRLKVPLLKILMPRQLILIQSVLL